ncbi:MAG: hypothetical protein BWY82_02420 [Verrucomicrobia bacterium ADurb.Bin474]|nr:MAG: hypothetical protein BWY82_02420 [Verrucomicrobia bacterium ADurb.Bin474]
MPENEGQQERPDVRAIHVSIGHDDDLVVAGLGNVECSFTRFADAGSGCCDEGADLRVAEHLVQAGLLNVQDFPPQWKDGLMLPVTSLFCGSSC